MFWRNNNQFRKIAIGYTGFWIPNAYLLRKNSIKWKSIKVKVRKIRKKRIEFLALEKMTMFFNKKIGRKEEKKKEADSRNGFFEIGIASLDFDIKFWRIFEKSL